jgi:hypothetical protein
MQFYFRWLFQPALDDASLCFEMGRLKDFVRLAGNKLASIFGFRAAEMWRLNRQRNELKKSALKRVTVPWASTGLAGFSLKTQSPLSAVQLRIHSAFHPHADGAGDESFLSIPVIDFDAEIVDCVALGGKHLSTFFTNPESSSSRESRSLSSPRSVEANFSRPTTAP